MIGQQVYTAVWTPVSCDIRTANLFALKSFMIARVDVFLRMWNGNTTTKYDQTGSKHETQSDEASIPPENQVRKTV
nr:hypothetical protein CFP56_10374 [Quercus suber]